MERKGFNFFILKEGRQTAVAVVRVGAGRAPHVLSLKPGLFQNLFIYYFQDTEVCYVEAQADFKLVTILLSSAKIAQCPTPMPNISIFL